MGLIYSVSVLFFTFMIFRMYLKKDIRPYMTSRVVTLLTILGLLPYVNTVIIIATLGDAVVKFNEYRNLTKQERTDRMIESLQLIDLAMERLIDKFKREMIVKSILDTDLYKFTTSYAYMKLFPQARGTFEFFDRDLTEYPEDFVQKVYLELSNLGMLRLTNSELDYMTSNCRFVPQVYWEWLYSFRFNSGKVQVWLDDKKHLHITVTDYLYKVTLYEVPILAIISELRNRVLGNNCDMSEVIKKLEPKLRLSNVAGIKIL